MNITQIQGAFQVREDVERTDEDLRREFNYIVAEQITRKLLEKGLITPGEFDSIMAENRRKFSPAIAGIMP